ncbi:MAG: hypothetical protein AB1Z98_23715 [Nannocystaceae bacterium]
MPAPLRTWPLAAALLTLTLACDSKEPSMSKAAEQAEQRDAAEAKAKAEADAKLAAQAKAAKADEVANPWKFEDVKATLEPGMVLDYEMTGTDIKGKPVQDVLHGEITDQEDLDVEILEYKKSAAGNPAVTQPQGHPWGNLSPFFWVEQSEVEYLRREPVTVPAGQFECVVAEITGFFGKHLTVWMIVDKPGVYAQVVEHPNTKSAEEDDPTEITYRLASIDFKR